MKEMTIHSSILAWAISWTEEPGRLQSIALQRVRYDLATKQQQDFTQFDYEKKTLFWRQLKPPTDHASWCCIYDSRTQQCLSSK